MTDYIVTIKNIANDVPADVLVEHIGYAVRNLTEKRRQWAGGITIERVQGVKLEEDPKSTKSYATGGYLPRQHPFDGPEMFDDEPCFLPIPQGLQDILEGLPYLSELIRNRQRPTPPEGEGDWNLVDEDKVGDDID